MAATTRRKIVEAAESGEDFDITISGTQYTVTAEERDLIDEAQEKLGFASSNEFESSEYGEETCVEVRYDDDWFGAGELNSVAESDDWEFVKSGMIDGDFVLRIRPVE